MKQYKEDFETLEQINKIVYEFHTKSKCNGYSIQLLERIGATVLGVKPAELMNIPVTTDTNHFHWKHCKGCLLQHKDLKVREIDRNDKRIKVLFYHEQALQETLSIKVNANFLKSLGYPTTYSLEGYLDLLVERLQGDQFPDEIGLFLGYPLKDVLGFTGRFPLKLIKTKGWKYYGSEKVSQIRYESFLEARLKVKELISSIPS